MRDHKPGCPRLQFWDAGEWEAPCTCDDDEPERSDDMSATKVTKEQIDGALVFFRGRLSDNLAADRCAAALHDPSERLRPIYIGKLTEPYYRAAIAALVAMRLALIERSGDDKPGYPTAEEVEGALGELARFITYVEQDLARDCVSQGVWDALDVLRRAIGVTVKE